MIVINLFGGPGSGKTTTAYYLVSRLKAAGIRAELVGEAARELIYDHPFGSVPSPLINNQTLVTGLQYERLLRLERHGIEVAVSDSPLIQGTLYEKENPKQLTALVKKLQAHFPDTYNVCINRTLGKYDSESRVQKTEAEAVEYDATAFALAQPVWQEMWWGYEDDLVICIIRLVLGGLKESYDTTHKTELL